MNRQTRQGRRASLGAPALVAMVLAAPLAFAATEAPTGIDNLTNGFEPQAQFDLDRQAFEETEGVEDGLGPIFNSVACAACHLRPVTGATSQINEARAARTDGTSYADPPGGSLINDLAIAPGILERTTEVDNLQSTRLSLATLGDGFIEAISDEVLKDVAASQPAGLRGHLVQARILEAPSISGTTTPTFRVGRFGWKSQHASLLSFAADAYLNEMGITNPLFPEENTSYGRSVADFDSVPDPEDPPTSAHPLGADVEAFTRFMRSTKPPGRAPVLGSVIVARGEVVFKEIGCSICHTPTFTTVPAGTVLNGDTFVVPPALGDKIIHPYSDFLVHDVGTGDPIIQNGDPLTFLKVRTPPLWGLRFRSRLMHDGASLTPLAALLRHNGQAAASVTAYQDLADSDQTALLAFLGIL